MADEVSRDEFTHLEARVSVVEQEVEGEKLVTRHILEHTRRNTDEVAGLRVEVASLRKDLTGKIDSLDGKIDSVASDLTGLRGTVHGLAANLPRIVGDAVREAMRVHKAK
jgi:methyl-accepting chemotaxis protein